MVWYNTVSAKNRLFYPHICYHPSITSLQMEEASGERHPDYSSDAPTQMIPGKKLQWFKLSSDTCWLKVHLIVLLYPAGRWASDVTSCGLEPQRNREASSSRTEQREVCGGTARRSGPAGKLHHGCSGGSSAADDWHASSVFGLQRADARRSGPLIVSCILHTQIWLVLIWLTDWLYATSVKAYKSKK